MNPRTLCFSVSSVVVLLASIMPPVLFILSEEPIQIAQTVFKAGEGAEAQFLGVVRGLEDDRAISGIDYSAYLPMAEKTLQDLVDRGQREHGPHRVFIQHRLGFVAAEQPSIVIRVRTKHSGESFELCHWYLKEIKTRVPIWKKPVFAL
jgi:molybdopterin synthase catalytic subunit